MSTEDDNIKWSEPPERIRTGGKRTLMKGFVSALRARPGQWAEATYASGFANDSARRAHAYYLRRRYMLEVATRKVDGVVRVWARWSAP